MPSDRTHFFYQNGHLHTLKTGDENCAFFRGAANVAHAELHSASAQSDLLATDDKGSVLQVQGNEAGKSDTDQP
ncbi:MAG: hypothetical protein ACN6PW_12505 [Pseudomonas kermanshahensis]|jgi:hypothetical protein|uniref:hypothetical protein n=1 Tax=Pseudomonas kermanshahensis TaxID=2745482 RepID=UPI002092E430|nr:hypothetical protein [Pseudomonas kermanshahensis]USS53660.1 hypothetical protein NG836_17765 [Pseudomonas kermanshahensis]